MNFRVGGPQPRTRAVLEETHSLQDTNALSATDGMRAPIVWMGGSAPRSEGSERTFKLVFYNALASD